MEMSFSTAAAIWITSVFVTIGLPPYYVGHRVVDGCAAVYHKVHDRTPKAPAPPVETNKK